MSSYRIGVQIHDVLYVKFIDSLFSRKQACVAIYSYKSIKLGVHCYTTGHKWSCCVIDHLFVNSICKRCLCILFAEILEAFVSSRIICSVFNETFILYIRWGWGVFSHILIDVYMFLPHFHHYHVPSFTEF